MKGPRNRGGGGGAYIKWNGQLQLLLVLKLVQMRVEIRIFAMQ